MRHLKDVANKQKYVNKAMIGMILVASITIILMGILTNVFYYTFPIEAMLGTIVTMLLAYVIKRLVDCVILSTIYRKEVMKGH